MNQPLLIAIMGPTASGKTQLAEGIADRFGLQLINADAFMVYQGLDIGTNKPIRKNRYELIDIVGPAHDFGVGEWVRRACRVLEGLYSEGRGAVVVGGTGFYVRALFEQYQDLGLSPEPQLRAMLAARLEEQGLGALADELHRISPEVAQKTDLKNPVRVLRALERLSDHRPPVRVELPPFIKSKFILDRPTEELDRAIEKRVEEMFEAGWINEVTALLEKGVPVTATAFRAIGYECVIDLINDRVGRQEAGVRIATETRQYARRQRTWLRSEPNVKALMSPDRAFEEVVDCLKEPGI